MRIWVIGAGLGGLAAALLASERGHDVTIVAKGIGGLLLSPGTLDVLGNLPDGRVVDDPFGAMAGLVSERPDHPYAAIGADAVRSGIDWLTNVVGELGYRSTGANVLVPTAVGGVRPTWAAPSSLAVISDGGSYVVVGVDTFKDLPARLAADNLSRSRLAHVTARHEVLQFSARAEHDSTATTIARALDDDPALRGTLIQGLRRIARDGDTLLVPGFLGLRPATVDAIRSGVGTPLGEVTVAPPSVPGRRLNDALVGLCRDRRIDIQLNAAAVGVETSGDTHVTRLVVQRAGRVTTHRADAVVHAGGGFESGTLARDASGHITETVLGLPVFTPDGRADVDLHTDEDLLRCGVAVNEAMNPIDPEGRPVYDNVYCVGGIIGGALAWKEHSGEGIALGSAWRCVRALDAGSPTTDSEVSL